MNEQELIPHLFRTEYRKIVAVLARHFGIAQMEIAEDIAGETFLLASEVWGLKGLPENPTAWLYAVAKNKTKDYLKHNAVFFRNVVPQLKAVPSTEEMEIDLSVRNINDSQLAMIFAVCYPGIAPEAQVGLALNILCGFGAEEIATAFLSSRDAIYKRLQRAKEILRNDGVKLESPTTAEIDARLDSVLMTLYLLFNEGYYSGSQETSIRTEFCSEAMQLAKMLIDHQPTNTPEVNALFALMCFQSSRLAARMDENGDAVLYFDQDITLWDGELIERGKYYLDQALSGTRLSRFQLEATIAFWHTQRDDTREKWENILQLYNRLLMIEYSPVVALNRTYALAMANGKRDAIAEAEKIELKGYPLYHALLGKLYTEIDNEKAVAHFQSAKKLARSPAERRAMEKEISRLVIGN
jgi:predicted RNA polymerase sigma factor